MYSFSSSAGDAADPRLNAPADLHGNFTSHDNVRHREASTGLEHAMGFAQNARNSTFAAAGAEAVCYAESPEASPSSRNRLMSFVGALPKKRQYSRLNCAGLE